MILFDTLITLRNFSMNKISIATLGLLAVFVTYISAPMAQDAKDEEYVFRNQVRPVYEKNIDLEQLYTLKKNANVTLIDVRLTEDFALDPILIPGAVYKDPENISSWAQEIPKDSKIVLYCVKGAWVSHKAATYLNEKGYDVVTLDGGIRQWKKENYK